jgi:ADP-ribosyl-[dinitrogen reductase] hydrolase
VKPEPIRQRATAAYLGLAIGDALGATVEFMTPNEIRHHYGLHQQIVGGGWLKLAAGEVTDDTTMALALGEAILASDGEIDGHAIARAFDRWLRARPVDVGNTVRRGILHWRQSGSPAVPLNPADGGNGAVMRLLPVVLATLTADRAVRDSAILTQAHVTHHSVESDGACIVTAAILHDLILGEGLTETLERHWLPFIARYPAFDHQRRRRDHPGGYVVETMQAVVQALIAQPDYRTTLIDVVNRGGDADTTGAIAGMLAAAHYGLAGLPDEWLKVLNPTIADACRQQAVALIELCSETTRADLSTS